MDWSMVLQWLEQPAAVWRAGAEVSAANAAWRCRWGEACPEALIGLLDRMMAQPPAGDPIVAGEVSITDADGRAQCYQVEAISGLHPAEGGPAGLLVRLISRARNAPRAVSSDPSPELPPPAASRSAEPGPIDPSGAAAVIGVDLNGVVRSWDETATAIFGYSPQEALGRALSDLAPPLVEDEDRRIVERLAAGLRIEPFETLRHRRDGSEVELSAEAWPVRDHSGRIVAGHVTLRDVSSRKRLERELLTAQALLEAVAETAPLLILAIDPTRTRVLYANALAGECLDLPRADEAGRSGQDQLAEGTPPLDARRWHIHPDDARSLQHFLQKAAEGTPTTERLTHEARLRHRQEGYRLLRLHARPVLTAAPPQAPTEVSLQTPSHTAAPNPDPAPPSTAIAPRPSRRSCHGLLIVGEDVTGSKTTTEVCRRAERLAGLGTLMAGIAHEINTPLTTILVGAHLLKQLLEDVAELPIAAESQANLANILEAAEHCAAIAERILTFARGRPGGHTPHSLPQLVDDALHLAGNLLRQRGAGVEVDLPESLPTVRVNATEVQQVLINLLRNAAQARAGHIRISARPAPPGHVRVTVSDDGQGMSQDQLDRALQPFVSAHHDEGGTGLGLSICHGIITEHGGRLELESRPRQGTSVHFTLPIAAEQRPARPPPGQG